MATTHSDQDIMSPLGRRLRPLYTLTERPQKLEGLVVGLLDNSKRNADLLLDEIGRALLGQGVARIERRRKPSAAISAGVLLDELTEQCDVVVNAHGDCGSCTSWCIHDSVELEKRGVPVATINTTEFAPLGRFEAIALGMPSLPIVTVPHPIGSVAESTARERARAVVGEILQALTGQGVEELSGGGVCQITPGAASGEDCGCDT